MLNKRILVLMFVVAFLFVGCLPTPTPPNEAPIITSTPITTATIGVLYTYDVNATDPDGDTLTYSLTVKPAGMTIKSATGVISWRPISTQIGNNSVSVKVFDGTLSVIQSFTIKVKTVNHAPIINSTPITTATVGVAYVYGVNATDPDNDVLTYSLTNYPSGMTISSASGLIMWTPTVKGNFAVIVKVSDGALSDTQGFTITVSELPVINQAPVITSTPNLTATVGVKYTYTIKATDPDGDAITYYLVSEPTGMTFDGIATISWTPVLGQVGTHDVTVKASDGKKDATQDFTITVSKVPELITVRWLENSVRFYPDGSVKYTSQNDLIPPYDLDYPDDPAKSFPPATLIHIDGEYHFADVKEYYNIHINVCLDLEGSVVISETGVLSGWATYNLSGLDTKNDFAGWQVEIITGEEVETITYNGNVITGHDGIIVGTYTQWKYVYVESSEDLVILANIYPKAVLAPEQGTGWWFTSRTEYTAHGGE